MGTEKGIEPPQTLASLPHPIDPVQGKVSASCVYSLRNSRKRKRPEVVVGVDGEGASIFNIKSPGLVTSYALPPQSVFAAAPLSIYRKRGKSLPAERVTYAPIISRDASERSQLVRFVEEVKHIPGAGPVTTKFDLPSDHRVFSVDFLSSSPDSRSDSEGFDVLILQHNGEAICLSEDLQTVRWKTSATHGSKVSQVQYASLEDGRSTTKGLLRSRQDVTAVLDPTGQRSPEALQSLQILCIVVKSRKRQAFSQMHLSLVQPQVPGLSSSRSPLTPILTLNIPSQSTRSDIDQPVEYALHSASGSLYQLARGSITIYDLSGTVPTTKVHLEGTTPFESFHRLSSSFLVASSAQSCGIYDSDYGSQQAVCSLRHESGLRSPQKRRKLSNASVSSPSLKVVSYFSDLELLVGVLDNELVGFQINPGPKSNDRNDGMQGFLIDAIGRGIRSKIIGDKPKLKSKKRINNIQEVTTDFDDNWPSTRDQLSRFVENGDIEAYERTFAEALDMPYIITPSISRDRGMVNGIGMESDASDKDEPTDDESNVRWVFESSSRLQPRREKGLFALRTMFTTTSGDGETGSTSGDSESFLSIRFFSPNVFQWLLLTGQLRGDLVSTALQDTLETQQATSVTDADIISALVFYDPDMHLLHQALRERVHLPVTAVAQSIKHLVRSLDNTPSPPPSKPASPQRLLESTDEFTNDELLTAAEDAAAAADLDHALNTLESGLATRSRSLRHALTRLHAFPPNTIAPVLRSCLTRHELVFLIQILRVELADGGWTSRYIDAGPPTLAFADDEEEGRPSDRGIGIIADLLGKVLDALGLGGWLSGNGSTMGADELLYALRAEVSAALEGIHEATFLEGLLGEFMLYESDVKKAKGSTSKNQAKDGSTITTEIDSQTADGLGAILLPVGLKSAKSVERTKTLTDGAKKEKSRREIGLEISSRVPKYSLERVRF